MRVEIVIDNWGNDVAEQTKAWGQFL